MSLSADTEQRARSSRGESSDAIHSMVESALRSRGLLDGVGTLADVGCGSGELGRRLRGKVRHYVGVDAVRYDGWRDEDELHIHDLDRPGLPLGDATADVVVAVETIEHLENPWAFMRELARIARPGGWVVITTPNQLSVLSKATLVMKGQFNAFQDSNYPAHRTALVVQDLVRIGAAAGLVNSEIAYSRSGRIPGTGAHFPRAVSALFPAACSDNVLFIAQRRE